MFPLNVEGLRAVSVHPLVRALGPKSLCGMAALQYSIMHIFVRGRWQQPTNVLTLLA